MNKQKINKIYLKNFKHINESEINFDNNNLIVLDGPNGFGKTTIFDAIELVITGKISRITNTIDRRMGYEYNLFSNKSDIDTEVRIEFETNENIIVIAKRIDSKKRFTQRDNKPDNWNVFQTYLLPEFTSKFEDGNKISTKDVEDILGIPDLERFFNLFYYVQQEENTLFLKKNGKERMEAISSLFDTKEEESELSKINNAKRLISKKKEAISNQIQSTKNLLRNWTNELDKMAKDDNVNKSFFKLLNRTQILEWDRENITVDITTREKYLNELRDIYKLRKNIEDFLGTQFNNQIDNYLKKNELLLNTINYSNFLEKHDEYTALKTKERSLKRLEKVFSKSEIEKKIDLSSFKDINEILQLSLNIPEIRSDIQNLQLTKSKMSDFSKIFQEFKGTREDLLNSFDKIKRPEDTNCPLCDSPFDSYNDLLESIQEKEKKFEKLTDKEGKLYEQQLDNIDVKYIASINQEIKNYLSDSKNIVSDEFYDSLTSAVKMKDQILEFSEWCKNNNLKIDIFLNGDSIKTTNKETKFQELTRYILSKKKTISTDYKEHENKKFIFDNIFGSNDIELRSLKLENIEKKAAYINSLFYSSGSKKVKELTSDLEQNEKQERKLIISEKEISDIIDIYKKEIASHWRKIIRDIEIPFYIYSGKIIQNYQLGCGLFIHERDNYEKSIMFVSGFENDHDAINYLSSGQLSGLVIAFTLALNKVYEQKSLSVLLIDDPVQSMDEINIASLVELLRNDFSHKQIILSTHEEEISKYIRYKFSKYNLNTKRINVKNKLYK